MRPQSGSSGFMNEIAFPNSASPQSLNENFHTLQLWQFLPAREGWGSPAGAAVRQKLAAAIAARPDVGLFRLSLQNVKRLDVTFAAAAIVGLIEEHRTRARLCLVNLADADLIENIAAAAGRAQVPVTIWTGEGVQVLGLTPGSAGHDALAFALARPQGVRAADFARAAGVSIANASSRFKQLADRGGSAAQRGLSEERRRRVPLSPHRLGDLPNSRSRRELTRFAALAKSAARFAPASGCCRTTSVVVGQHPLLSE
jgi:hypothetical protein